MILAETLRRRVPHRSFSATLRLCARFHLRVFAPNPRRIGRNTAFRKSPAERLAPPPFAHWRMKGTSQWTGWCVPWAAVLETHLGNAPASVELLHAWDEYFTNPGHASIIYPWKPGFGRYGKPRHRHGIRDRKSKRRLDAYAKEKNGRGRW